MLEDLTKKFRYILSLIGIDKNEICILDNLYCDNSRCDSFICKLKNANEIIKLTISYGSPIKTERVIKVDYNNTAMIYQFRGFNSKQDILKLEQIIIKENDNIYLREFSPISCKIKIKNDKYTFSLFTYSINPNNKNDLILPNEEEVKKYLLSLTFPINITEVYTNLYNLSLINYDSINNLSIRVEKINENHSVITDEIIINNDKLDLLTVTKNGKTITLDNDGNWTYVYKKLVVNGNSSDEIDYTLKSISYDEISNYESLTDRIDTAKNEIAEVRKLSLNMGEIWKQKKN